MTCDWLETEQEPKSLQEINLWITNVSGDVDDPYSTKWLKQKLLEKYGSNISFTVKGRENVVYLSNVA